MLDIIFNKIDSTCDWTCTNKSCRMRNNTKCAIYVIVLVHLRITHSSINYTFVIIKIQDKDGSSSKQWTIQARSISSSILVSSLKMHTHARSCARAHTHTHIISCILVPWVFFVQENASLFALMYLHPSLTHQVVMVNHCCRYLVRCYL